MPDRTGKQQVADEKKLVWQSRLPVIGPVLSSLLLKFREAFGGNTWNSDEKNKDELQRLIPYCCSATLSMSLTLLYCSCSLRPTPVRDRIVFFPLTVKAFDPHFLKTLLWDVSLEDGASG